MTGPSYPRQFQLAFMCKVGGVPLLKFSCTRTLALILCVSPRFKCPLLINEQFYCNYFVYRFTVYPYGNYVMQPVEVKLLTGLRMKPFTGTGNIASSVLCLDNQE